MKWRKDIFEEIVDELGYDEDDKKVSCNPSSYTGTGGAMGVAQFMSDTWSGWKSRIASATGNKTPDPWDLFDGVMAMALKLEEDGAAKSGDVRIVNPCDRDEKIKVDWEDYAAMKYLGWSCYALTNYAPGIQNLKDGYDDL
jgi:membrane-bound lytic murein transglycosylase B